MYKEDLALNNLQWLICYKNQPTCLKHLLAFDSIAWKRTFLEKFDPLCRYFRKEIAETEWKITLLYIRFKKNGRLVAWFGVTLEGYLMPNPVYTCILNQSQELLVSNWSLN